MRYTVRFPQNSGPGAGRAGAAASAPPIQTFSLEIPAGMADVAVPVEFKDITLP